jgi:hypothetical protein
MMTAPSTRSLVRPAAAIAFLSAVGAPGCTFDGDVSLGNNHKGAAAASGDETGGSQGSTGGSGGAGGSDEKGGLGGTSGSRATGGSGATGGSSATSGAAGSLQGGASSGGQGPPEGGASTGGSGPASGGASGSGAGDAGTPSGGVGGFAGGGGASDGGSGGGGNATYLGCTFVGGYDRIVVSKRDAQNDRCISLVLWGSRSSPPADVMLPEGWYVETVGVGPADECPSRVATRVTAMVSGTVTFLEGVPGVAGHPTHVAADVTFAFPPGQDLPASESLRADSVDVRRVCNAACGTGRDSDCNDDGMLSSLHGRCTPANTCVCSGTYETNPVTGRCL